MLSLAREAQLACTFECHVGFITLQVIFIIINATKQQLADVLSNVFMMNLQWH